MARHPMPCAACTAALRNKRCGRMDNAGTHSITLSSLATVPFRLGHIPLINQSKLSVLRLGYSGTKCSYGIFTPENFHSEKELLVDVQLILLKVWIRHISASLSNSPRCKLSGPRAKSGGGATAAAAVVTWRREDVSRG